MFVQKIIAVGNSFAVVLPGPILNAINAKRGDLVDLYLTVDDGLVIYKHTPKKIKHVEIREDDKSEKH